MQKALKDAVNLNLSEADIIRASNKVERFLNASAKLLVDNPDLLPFLQENMKRAHNSKSVQLMQDIDIDYEKSFARLEHLKNQPEFRQFQQLVHNGELDNIGTLKKRLSS